MEYEFNEDDLALAWQAVAVNVWTGGTKDCNWSEYLPWKLQ